MTNTNSNRQTEIIYRKAGREDAKQLRKLWLDCFFENKRALNAVFDGYFSQMSVYCACINGVIVSALYLVNGSLNGAKAHYLCGASTYEQHRGQGIMSALIEYALNDAHKRGDKYSLLLPANEGLYKFYASLGYKPNCFACKVNLTKEELYKFDLGIPEKYTDGVNNLEFSQMQEICFPKNSFLNENSFFDFAVNYYSAYGIKAVREKNCFALIDETDACADVLYILYDKVENLKKLLLDNTKAERFTITLNCNDKNFAAAKTEHCGMIKVLSNNLEAVNNIYIGITLN